MGAQVAALGGTFGLVILVLDANRIEGVKLRTRKYVALAGTVLVAVIYSRLAGGWGDGPYYAGAAGFIVVIGLVALPWMELAPDGAFRREPRSGPDGRAVEPRT